jgi:hypothetical protein
MPKLQLWIAALGFADPNATIKLGSWIGRISGA